MSTIGKIIKILAIALYCAAVIYAVWLGIDIFNQSQGLSLILTFLIIIFALLPSSILYVIGELVGSSKNN